jgi:hypothetical protein
MCSLDLNMMPIYRFKRYNQSMANYTPNDIERMRELGRIGGSKAAKSGERTQTWFG